MTPLRPKPALSLVVVAALGLLVGVLVGCSAPTGQTELHTPQHPLPFRAQGDYLAAYDPTSDTYTPFFMKGMNLGVGVPGTQPGELAVTRDQYRRWIERMGEIGINTLRVYTLHYPRFYEEFAAYNARNPDAPMWLLQGIWLDEDNPTGDFFNVSEAYDHEIRTVIAATHGDAVVEQTYGKAFGTYTVDVSPWVVGWVVGREIYPDEVEITDAQNAAVVRYDGDAVSVDATTPMTAWLAERIDTVIVTERDTYGVQRPVAFSSWPTLDPLRHPIEGDGSDEDRVNLDLTPLDFSNAPGGFFIIYHAYPYYPDFIVETPEYSDAEDAFGRNSYLGYLLDLKAHYEGIPVVIGEFGTPSSWGNAHFSQTGMHHGGHDETATGHFAARMIANLYDSGCAGGAYFAWMDEWWKRTWITDELDFPRERRYRWHNLTAAEQNFGLIAFDVGPPDYDALPAVEHSGRIERVRFAANAEAAHVEITLASPLVEGESLVVGFDTYRDDLGESVLPNGVPTATRRSEFALQWEAGATVARHHTTPAYDTYGIWHQTADDRQRFHSIPSDTGEWVLVRWKNNSAHLSEDLQYAFPETATEIGVVPVRSAAAPPSSSDAVVTDGAVITIRMPWSLLLFTDPSQRAVLDDDRTTDGREVATSEGIGLAVSVGDALVETPRWRWPMWDDAPPTVEREKPSMALVAQGYASVPSWIDPTSPRPGAAPSESSPARP